MANDFDPQQEVPLPSPGVRKRPAPRAAKELPAVPMGLERDRGQWYYGDGFDVRGPIPFARLQNMVLAGRIAPDTMVRQSDSDCEWADARDVPGLVPIPAEAPGEPVAEETPPPAARPNIKHDIRFIRALLCIVVLLLGLLTLHALPFASPGVMFVGLLAGALAILTTRALTQ